MAVVMDFAQELEFAKTTALAAGELMLKYFQVGAATQAKQDGSPITKADRAINSMVIAAVKKSFPNHGLLGEEESYTIAKPSCLWVCDPIDGTLPYSLGMPTNVFSLAAVNQDGLPIVAVVYDPYMQRMYWASRGSGAFLNSRRIRVNGVGTLQDALIGNSGRHSNVLKADEFKGNLYGACYRAVIINSVIYEAMLVASGQIAATVLTGAGCHDAVSAKLIVEEAGGTVTDLFGCEQRYDRPITGAVISNGVIHSELVSLAKIYKL